MTNSPNGGQSSKPSTSNGGSTLLTSTDSTAPSNSGGNSSNASTGGSTTASPQGGTSSNNSADGGSSNATSEGGSSTGSTATGHGGTNSTGVGDGGTATVTRGGASRGGTNGSSAKGGSGGAKTGSGGKASVAGAASVAHAGSVAAGSTCGNSEKDGDETDVDCGGSCAPTSRCAVGAACVFAKDCASTSCPAKVCVAPTVIVKTQGCTSTSTTCTAVAGSLQSKVQVLNVGTSALSLKGLEIRYYFTDEVATTPVIEVFDKSIATFDISVVAMPTPTATADHYVKVVYSAGSIVADLDRKCDRGSTNMDCADFTFSLHTADYQGSYDPTNDYSFIPSSSIINNGNITVHQGTEIIWGTPPS
ncbi:MAG TPA: cellulose binding domain-containing protein [Polyangiaceae bacterium]